MSNYVEFGLLPPTVMSSHLATWKVKTETNSPLSAESLTVSSQ